MKRMWREGMEEGEEGSRGLARSRLFSLSL